MEEHDIQIYPEKKKKRKLPGAVTALIMAVILVGSNLFTYFYVSKWFPTFSGKKIVIEAENEAQAVAINKLVYLYGILKDNYLWELDEQKLWDGALHGFMEATGDPYTLYMDKTEYLAYMESSQPSYSGIGAKLTNNEDGNVEITKVFNSSPALTAGLRAGDVIVSAGEQDLRDTNINIAVTYVRGDEGTTVTLGVLRDGEVFYVDIVRAKLDVVYCEAEMLSSGYGYIHIYEFESNTYEQFKAALDELSAQGMKGLILDLRQNPGGAVNQAIKVADELLPECEVIYTVNGSGKKEFYYSSAGCISVPVVVMVDEYSASSSEIVTASLKDNNAASVVGTTSYGKGIMQMVIPLSDGTLYQYTFCEYFAPSGVKIHGIGVEPDYAVDKGEAYKYTLVENIPLGEDVQLNKAIEVLDEKTK